ncbi:MAG: aromatic hydrocarbon degradation protein [Dechloromonas sp.]|nr:MAG: aromatic hydrocarbon degradation protein [Dechloromonas sp.]
MQKLIKPRLIPALLAIAFSGSAAAAGFQLQNQSGSANGNAFAGAAAAAEDASTIFFNPAGMTYLPRGHNISVSGTVLHRSIKFKDEGSTTTPGFGFGSSFPLPTGDGGDGGGTSLLPHGYWAWGVNDRISIGLGMGPTFGNTTEYNDDFVGRNAGFFFEMKQFNINPSLAFKVNDMVSLGVGINFAHNESHFKQGVPLVMALAGYPENNYLDVKGDDWAVGYNLGAMFQLTPTTRLGLAYRSRLEFELEGRQRWAVASPGFGPVAPLVNADVKAKLTTPANFSIALSQMVGQKWEILGDLTWTDWSVVDTLYVNNRQTGVPLQKLTYNFKDTWRVGLGANYQYSDSIKLRFGIAHDKTPVKSSADRTMTLPDADRTWLSLGAKFQLSKAASVDVGYTHIFFDTVKTNRAVTTGYPGVETLRQTIRGEFKTSVDILSAQLNYNF